ncbi:MAG TPA: hypothetical protein VK138_04510 [Acidiferrobacterales bacterium]|nr:hypothetical protein [Acidiferrobacterales bacterium]
MNCTFQMYTCQAVVGVNLAIRDPDDAWVHASALAGKADFNFPAALRALLMFLSLLHFF